MKRIFAVLFFAALTANSFAQNSYKADRFKPYLMELVENLNPKMMSKDWKSRQADWEKEVKAAEEAPAMAKLTLELQTMLKKNAFAEQFDAATWKKGITSMKSMGEYGAYLIALDDGITAQAKLPAWEERRGAWVDAVVNATQKLVSDSQRIYLQMGEFEGPFKRAWADVRIGFKNIKVGEAKEVPGVGEAYATTVKMPRTKVCQIIKVQEDDSYVLQYVALWDAGNFEDNADHLRTQVEKYLDAFAEEGYVKDTNYWDAYKDSERLIWEIDSDDFTTKAKNPTVTLGIIEKQGKYFVELRIAEPVFK